MRDPAKRLQRNGCRRALLRVQEAWVILFATAALPSDVGSLTRLRRVRDDITKVGPSRAPGQKIAYSGRELRFTDPFRDEVRRGFLAHSCLLKASFTSGEGPFDRLPGRIQPQRLHPQAAKVLSSNHTNSRAMAGQFLTTCDQCLPI